SFVPQLYERGIVIGNIRERPPGDAHHPSISEMGIAGEEQCHFEEARFPTRPVMVPTCGRASWTTIPFGADNATGQERAEGPARSVAKLKDRDGDLECMIFATASLR